MAQRKRLGMQNIMIIMAVKNKKQKILDLYANDPTMQIEKIAFFADCSEAYASSIINKYETDMINYYHLCIAPACTKENEFYLFNDNGIQKLLSLENNIVTCKDKLTKLEALFVKINLGKEIDEQSLSKISD